MDIHDYSSLYDREHPTSKTHPRMSRMQRAAQFSPFAALTGYEEAIQEEGRQVEQKKILSEEEKEKINSKLLYLLEHRKENLSFRLTYFVKDEKKKGGRYRTIDATLRNIDELNHMLLLKNGEKVPIEDILSIDSDVFSSWNDEIDEE